MLYIQKYMVYSERSGNHIVSLCDDGTWCCDCIGWTRHYPRQNCKHIHYVIETKPAPLNKENWDKLNGKKRAVKKTLDLFERIQREENTYVREER